MTLITNGILDTMKHLNSNHSNTIHSAAVPNSCYIPTRSATRRAAGVTTIGEPYPPSGSPPRDKDIYYQTTALCFPSTAYYQGLVEGIQALEQVAYNTDAAQFANYVIGSDLNATHAAYCFTLDIRYLEEVQLAPELECIFLANKQYSAVGYTNADIGSLIGSEALYHYLTVLHETIRWHLPRLRDNARRSVSRRQNKIAKKVASLQHLGSVHSVRLDLFYAEDQRGRTSFQMMQDHWQEMNTWLQQEYGLYSYIWKLEFGLHKGFHIHLWLFYEARAFQYDSSKANELGMHWHAGITNGMGAFYSTNFKESREQLAAKLQVPSCTLCLGRVNLKQPSVRMHAEKLTGYLSKAEQMIPVKPSPQTRCFGIFKGSAWPKAEHAEFEACLLGGEDEYAFH